MSILDGSIRNAHLQIPSPLIRYMSENEIADISLLENIEGLLFSEEYADSEDNSSLISEIANAEIPTEENSDGNGEGAKESDASKSNSQNNNVKENVLNIDNSEDDFEKGFDSFAVERLSDSIKSNKGLRRLFIEKVSVKDRLILNFPIWAYGESEQFSLTSFMKDGFGSESLRESVGISREFVKPIVCEEKSKVSEENVKFAAPFANQEESKTLTRDVLRVEKPNKSEEKDNGLKFDSVNTEVPKVSKDPEKVNVFAEAERPNAPARDVLRVEKPNKSVDIAKDVKCGSVNKEISKVSSVDLEKTEISAKPEQTKSAPKKDFTEFKTDYKNIAANNAISITGDKSLSFTSSCSQKQDEMFFDTNEKAKRNSFDVQSYNGFRKDISRYTIPQRSSCFSLTERSLTKKNIDNAFEKKSRISMFSEKRISAYDCMKNDFKRKKELF